MCHGDIHVMKIMTHLDKSDMCSINRNMFWRYQHVLPISTGHAVMITSKTNIQHGYQHVTWILKVPPQLSFFACLILESLPEKSN